MFLVLFGLLAIFAFVFYQRQNTFKLPNGPSGLPFVGNIHQILQNPHLKLSKWAVKYGKVYTINLLGKPTLVVNEAKAMKEIFSSLASTGKLQSDVFECLYGGPIGIANSEGTVWLEQRQFMMKALRQFGFGKGTALEPVILGECDDLCKWIDNNIKTENSGVELGHILMRVSSNTLWNMVTGERMKSSESVMVQVLEEIAHELQIATKRGLAFSSSMKYWAPELSGYNRFNRVCQKMHKLVDKYFLEHRKIREDMGGAPADLIDAYIDQVENCKDRESTFYGEMGWKNSFSAVVSLLVAGSESTGATLNWLIFYLTVHLQVQTKLQEEIDTLIGENRDPSLNDRTNMPYMEAVIWETLRKSSLGPFGLIHKLIEPVEYEQYILPKDTLLMANVYHCHNDVTIWGDPETFRPERFLEGNKDQIKTLKDNVVAFQPGKRICPGESLVKDVLFLFATKLFQNYRFLPDDNISVNEYLEPVVGFLLMPKHLCVNVKPRK